MRCKHCKDKFEPKQFNRKYCYKDECNDAYFEWLKDQAIKKAQRKRTQYNKDTETVQQLMKRAQKVFNEFIRERDKGKKCISCSNKLQGKFDAGHYVSSGSCKALTFDENNVHGQCVACNQHKHGNLISYREGLIKRIGEANVLELEQRRHETVKYTRNELQQIITEYKQKVKNLK